MLAAAGIGAILSPPTLGAAAFIIAEFLRVSYLQVLVYALIPTLLYYLGILLAIESTPGASGARTSRSTRQRLLAAAGPLRLPLQLAVRDRRAARARPVGVQGRGLRDRARVPAVLPGPRATG